MIWTSEEQAARNALRARQGSGGRYDAAAAPHDDLLLARRGAAYFARKLNELHDHELYAPSLVAGWNRAHIVAHAGYHARALARLVEWARTGVEQAMYPSAEARDAEIDLGATLPAGALRNLAHHAAIHLDVEWRDLPDAGWDAGLRTFDGRDITARDTPVIRAAEIWKAGVELGNGGRWSDVPDVVRPDR